MWYVIAIISKLLVHHSVHSYVGNNLPCLNKQLETALLSGAWFGQKYKLSTSRVLIQYF